MHLREPTRSHDDEAASRLAPKGDDGSFDLHVGPVTQGRANQCARSQ
jgi:hypothetical protein